MPWGAIQAAFANIASTDVRITDLTLFAISYIHQRKRLASGVC